MHSRIAAWAMSVLVLPFGVSAQGAFEVASVKPDIAAAHAPTGD